MFMGGGGAGRPRGGGLPGAARPARALRAKSRPRPARAAGSAVDLVIQAPSLTPADQIHTPKARSPSWPGSCRPPGVLLPPAHLHLLRACQQHKSHTPTHTQPQTASCCWSCATGRRSQTSCLTRWALTSGSVWRGRVNTPTRTRSTGTSSMRVGLDSCVVCCVLIEVLMLAGSIASAGRRVPTMQHPPSLPQT